MKGYYRAPLESAEAVDPDGWFRTGDLANVDDGHYFIVGRAKEMIIRFGFNVYPAEVESVLNAHAGVSRAAVVGRKSETGEDVVAFVQCKPGDATTADDLAAHAARQLAPYKRPTRIVLVDALPLSPAGKIIKSALPA
jgi:acyl-CoA synthetase (AMP-forming)/AMP-acid ligase II